MGDPDPWRYIKEGHFQQAIDLYNHMSPDKITSITLANRAAAYLCARDYEGAARDYAALIQRDAMSEEGYSGLAVCRWCQRRPKEAIELWRAGLGAVYTDAAGVSIPGRLFYAGARLHDASVIREAKEHLRKRMRRKTVSNWPGAIAPYVLNKVSAADFEQAARVLVTSDVLLQRHLCQYHFYRGARGFSDADQPSFERHMRACAASGYGFLEHEYYLATWEVEQGFVDP